MAPNTAVICASGLTYFTFPAVWRKTQGVFTLVFSSYSLYLATNCTFTAIACSLLTFLLLRSIQRHANHCIWKNNTFSALSTLPTSPIPVVNDCFSPSCYLLVTSAQAGKAQTHTQLIIVTPAIWQVFLYLFLYDIFRFSAEGICYMQTCWATYWTYQTTCIVLRSFSQWENLLTMKDGQRFTTFWNTWKYEDISTWFQEQFVWNCQLWELLWEEGILSFFLLRLLQAYKHFLWKWTNFLKKKACLTRTENAFNTGHL